MFNCQVVYVTRNPKDLVCSYMHHHRILKVHDFKGTDEQFVDYFCKGDRKCFRLVYCLVKQHFTFKKCNCFP